MMGLHIGFGTDSLEEELYDVAGAAYIIHRHHTAEETSKECRVCEDVDGHKEGCPIAAIEAWKLRP